MKFFKTESEKLMFRTDLTHIRGQIYDLEIDLINVVTDLAENLITKEIKRLNRRLKLIEWNTQRILTKDFYIY